VTFRSDGPDVSAFQGADFDWVAARAATTGAFASCRVAHGSYTDSHGVVRPGFIDATGAGNRSGMIGAGFGRRCWYAVVTPLESSEVQAQRVATWVGLNGGLPAGECIAIDWEGNPNNGEAADVVQVLRMHEVLAAVFGSDRVGFYGSRGYLDQLPDARGWRWLASYTDDAVDAALERGCAVVQWTSSAQIPGYNGNLDMNKVVDPARLELACAPADVSEGNMVSHLVEVVTMGQTVGSFDLIEVVAGGGVRVAGWAVDPDTPTTPINVHVYIGGVHCGVVLADRERTDVPYGPNHGFDAVVAVPAVPVTIYGIDSGGDPNAVIGQKALAVTAVPIVVVPPPVDPPPVDPPPVDPQPPVLTVDDVTVIARTVARDEIGRAHLTPGA
jgi:hypothetical protein